VTKRQQLKETVNRLIFPPYRLKQISVVKLEFWLVVWIVGEVYGYCVLEERWKAISLELVHFCNCNAKYNIKEVESGKLE